VIVCATFFVRFLKRLSVLATLLLLSGIAVGQTHRIVAIDLKGAERTSLAWVKSYLGLHPPLEIDQASLETLSQKLMTTDVFVSVRLHVANRSALPQLSDDQAKILIVELEEKWTTIPVVRGVLGGGTPLTVVGVYNTHAFGRLWTLGAEGRRYGSAPWGGVAWARAPRWGGGKHFLSFEAWNMRRVRSVFDSEFEAIGSVRLDQSWFRMVFLRPLRDPRDYRQESSNLRLGLEVLSMQPQTPEFSGDTSPEGLGIDPQLCQNCRQLKALPTFMYDDVQINGLRYDGVRFIWRNGWSLTSRRWFKFADFEAFYFLPLPFAINFSSHLKIVASERTGMEDLTFLGGLESIRGIPEGSVYGSYAWYMNLELRQVIYRARYLHSQAAIFSDFGAADHRQFSANQFHQTIGAGVRLSIPQVYRLMLRVDYAWSVKDHTVSSINIGLNQFFQPYRPL
jgi:hypothetical protein